MLLPFEVAGALLVDGNREEEVSQKSVLLELKTRMAKADGCLCMRSTTSGLTVMMREGEDTDRAFGRIRRPLFLRTASRSRDAELLPMM